MAIDLHCHLLPTLDDGPETAAEAVGMARMAVADGTAVLVATPHINPGRFDNTPEGIEAAAQALRALLVEEGVALEVRVAAELRLGPWLLGWARAGRLPLLNGNQGGIAYCLLEFPHRGIEPGSLHLVELLRHRGITPLLAHPERIRTIQQDLESLAPYRELGCLCQVTAASFTGELGTRARQAAEALLERGWVEVLASDGHRFIGRHPVLSSGVRAVAALIGPQRAALLVEEHPRRILAGEPVVWSWGQGRTVGNTGLGSPS